VVEATEATLVEAGSSVAAAVEASAFVDVAGTLPPHPLKTMAKTSMERMKGRSSFFMKRFPY
jgi:hypothetical protein